MNKIKNFLTDDLLPQKIGLVVGGLVGVLVGMVISDRADQFQPVIEIDDEEEANGEAE